MPSGKVHDQITLVAAVAAAPVWWLTSPAPTQTAWECATLCGAILFSGLMLSPDLDLNSSIYKRWGPLRFLWWPYQKLLPHRSVFSHSFVVGPLLRLAYFFALLYGLWRALTYFVTLVVPSFDRNGLSQAWTGGLFGLWRTHPGHFQMAALGIFIGTGLHVAADFLVTGYKRRMHRRGRGKRRRGRYGDNE